MLHYHANSFALSPPSAVVHLFQPLVCVINSSEKTHASPQLPLLVPEVLPWNGRFPSSALQGPVLLHSVPPGNLSLIFRDIPVPGELVVRLPTLNALHRLPPVLSVSESPCPS